MGGDTHKKLKGNDGVASTIEANQDKLPCGFDNECWPIMATAPTIEPNQNFLDTELLDPNMEFFLNCEPLDPNHERRKSTALANRVAKPMNTQKKTQPNRC